MEILYLSCLLLLKVFKRILIIYVEEKQVAKEGISHLIPEWYLSKTDK